MRMFAILVFSFFSLIPSVMAHCLLCTGAVAAVAVSASYWGIQGNILGVFIGSFGISTGLWIGRKTKHRIPYQPLVFGILSFVATAAPLIGFAEIAVGSVAGAAATLASYYFHEYVKQVKGSVMFPYQGIVFTLISLAALSAALYLIR